MSKKILLILGGILILILIVVGAILYLNSTSSKSTIKNTNTQSNTTTTNSNANVPAGIKKVSDEAVISPVLAFDDRSLWYFSKDSRLYVIDLTSGLKQELLLPSKVAVTETVWPTKGQDFILASGSGPNKIFNYYNFEQKKLTQYPAGIKEVDFMPDGKRIAYNWVADGKSTLAIADADTTNFQTVIALPTNDLTIKVSPLGNKAFGFDRNNPQNGKLHLMFIDTKKLVTLPTSLENAAVWSPDGKKFMYNRNDDGKSQTNELWLGDSEAVSNKRLGIFTSVNKATFDKTGKFMYLAGSSVANGVESFWRVDVATLAKTEVYKPAQGAAALNATNLMVSSDSKFLFFKNADGLVYALSLSQ